MRTIKGVSIDPFQRTMRFVSIPRDVREVKRLCGADLLEVFRSPSGAVELWVDEMGQLRDDPGWWMASWKQLLAGRCFVCRPGFRSLTAPDMGYIARWIRPGMTQSLQQIRHLNRARIVTGADQFREWSRDWRDQAAMTEMLFLATEPAAPVQ